MKKLILKHACRLAAVAGALVLAGHPGGAMADAVFDRVKASGSVKVCIWPDYYGVTHRNPNTQQLQGIDHRGRQRAAES